MVEKAAATRASSAHVKTKNFPERTSVCVSFSRTGVMPIRLMVSPSHFFGVSFSLKAQ